MIKREKGLILTIGMLICLTVGQIIIPFHVSAKQEEQISLLYKYDSADTAAIKAVDTEKDTISFRNKDTGRDYTLSYDNTSLMYNCTISSPSSFAGLCPDRYSSAILLVAPSS